MTEPYAISTIALWDTKRFSTAEIADFLLVPESDVERVIHIHLGGDAAADAVAA